MTCAPKRVLTQKESTMSDDRSKTGTPDRLRVSTSEPYELRAWAKQFGVSEEKVKDAVAKVGPMVADVEKYLRK